jgi:ribosomal protein L7/L12
MPSVEIIGWKPGFEKVTHTQVLRELAGLSLSDAKAMTDAVLEGAPASVPMPTSAEARVLAGRLTQAGALVSFVD